MAEGFKINEIRNKKAELPDYIQNILNYPEKYNDGCSAAIDRKHTADILYTFALNHLVPEYCSMDMRWEYGPDGFRVYYGGGWDQAKTWESKDDEIEVSKFFEDKKVKYEVEFNIETECRLPVFKRGGTALSPAFSLVPNLEKVKSVRVMPGTITTYKKLRNYNDKPGSTKEIEPYYNREDSDEDEKTADHIEILNKVLTKKSLNIKETEGFYDKIPTLSEDDGNIQLVGIKNPVLTKVTELSKRLREFADFYYSKRSQISDLVLELNCPKCKKTAESELRRMKIPGKLEEYLR
jgi:hypothetical protein